MTPERLHARSREVAMQKVENAMFAAVLAICGGFSLLAVPLLHIG
jgi:hypothetical protein